MSDTTGWSKDSYECDYYKRIGDSTYMIYFCGTYWALRESVPGWSFYRGEHRLLADAKRAAHDHARNKHE
jgi:hypothetical protein